VCAFQIHFRRHVRLRVIAIFLIPCTRAALYQELSRETCYRRCRREGTVPGICVSRVWERGPFHSKLPS
jgi:hypothetical protein